MTARRSAGRRAAPAPEWSALRLAVLSVAAITLTVIIAITALLAMNREAPEGLIAIGAGGVGALSTLLTVESRKEAH